jgi:hypothetical protein
MPMNSYSFRSGSGEALNLEEYLAELLLRLRNGEEHTNSAIRALREINYEPVDLERLKIKWPEDQKQGTRKAPRYNLSIPVLICNNNKVFRTETENISMSGLLLKDTLPEDFSRHAFDVILIEKDEPFEKKYLLFRGRAAEGKLRTERVYFELSAKDSQQKLSEMIEQLHEFRTKKPA